MAAPDTVIFTDLDGTLLDHDTYDWRPAAPMLTRLKSLGIPVILASSKTAAEMIPLREALGLIPAAMICENGAGLVPAVAVDLRSGEDYAALRSALSSLPAPLRRPFEGFGDMSLARISELTGLGEGDAARAAARRFSEPGIWNGDAEGLQDFTDALAEFGISARRGGRFLTLSYGSTKADQVARIARSYGCPPIIALGDAPNDVEMLEAADYGVLLANPHFPPLPPMSGESSGRVRRSALAGPAGWAESVAAILSELGIGELEAQFG